MGYRYILDNFAVYMLLGTKHLKNIIQRNAIELEGRNCKKH